VSFYSSTTKPALPLQSRYSGTEPRIPESGSLQPHINYPSPLSVLTARQGREAPSTSHLNRHDTRHNRQWLLRCTRIRWCVCSAENKEKRTKIRCRQCHIGLCATPCFEVYHTKLNFWGSTDNKMENVFPFGRWGSATYTIMVGILLGLVDLSTHWHF
jgi:hypothetical protein